MSVIACGENIVIRSMEETESDLGLYLKWMTDPETMKYWQGESEIFTYERVKREYREQVEEQVYQCIIEYDGRAVGYCQFCTLNAEYYEVPEDKFYAFADKEDSVYGIDVFIGEVDHRNRGIGTKALKLLMGALFADWGADAIMIDPKTHNSRAIRCYYKCGFRDLFVVPQREALDGVYYDSLIMGVKKADFR